MFARKTLLSAFSIVLLVAAADAAHAGTLTISTTSGRLGDGGEFKISGFDDGYLSNVTTGINGGDFNTFCLEKNEFISLGSSYNYTIGTGAINGGNGGGNPDVISEATAKLYYTFWTDQWAVSTAGDLGQNLDYDYTNTSQRGKDGRDLQYAIWFLEDEITQAQLTAYVNANSGSQAQLMVNYANDADLTWADLGRGAWTGYGEVRVVNLYDSGGVARQSQLVVVPLPVAAVMGFGLLASMGLVSLVRRRHRDSVA